MPIAMLAVQTKAGPRQLGVATGATQFVRSVGLTVGTAVIGSLVTAGYVRGLENNAPEGAPERLVGALRDPNALVSQDALRALEGVASRAPGGAARVDGLLGAAPRRAASRGEPLRQHHEARRYRALAPVAARVAPLLRQAPTDPAPAVGGSGRDEGLVKLVREMPFRREFRHQTYPKEPKTCTVVPENS